MAKKPFAGLKVIEYGDGISAPYCTRLFAGLGAEVLKVEKPGSGDEARNHGPFPNDTPHPERSGLFLSLNANKLGITLNLDTKLGKDIFQRLIENTDVLVENNAPGHMEGLGLGYDSLQRINPRLVMASITPFGQSGPYRDYKAYHINSCATGGEAVGIGHPEREPLTMPFSQGGYQAGVSAAAAILVALLAREKIGKGQYIDISEVEVWATTHTGMYTLTFLYRGVTGIRRGVHGPTLYPCEILPCRDGYVTLNAPQLEQWIRFVEMIGNPEWSKNPRYRNRRAMGDEYPDEVNALLLPWLKEHTKEEILKLCQEKRVPCVPVYHIGEVVNHPQLKALNFFVEIEHSQAGKLKYPKGPCTFHKTDWEWERAAPLLGEHNQRVFGQRLGYSKEDLVNMKRPGVI